jgi:hypothetical protein
MCTTKHERYERCTIHRFCNASCAGANAPAADATRLPPVEYPRCRRQWIACGPHPPSGACNASSAVCDTSSAGATCVAPVATYGVPPAMALQHVQRVNGWMQPASGGVQEALRQMQHELCGPQSGECTVNRPIAANSKPFAGATRQLLTATGLLLCPLRLPQVQPEICGVQWGECGCTRPFCSPRQANCEGRNAVVAGKTSAAANLPRLQPASARMGDRKYQLRS